MITTPAQNVYIIHVFKVGDAKGIANVLRIVRLEYAFQVGNSGSQAMCQSRPNHRPRKCVLMKYFTETDQCGVFPSCCNTQVRCRFLYKFTTNVLSMKKIYSLLWTRMWLRPTFKFGHSVSCCLMTRSSSELHVVVVWVMARQDSCNVTSFEKKYLPSSVTSCDSKEKFNVLICQFLSMAAQFSSYDSYTSRNVKLWAGGSVWNRLIIPRSIRDKETLQHVRSYEGWNFNSGNYLFTTDTK